MRHKGPLPRSPLLFLLAASLFIVSCAGSPSTYTPPELYAVTVEHIRSDLKKGKIAQALQDHHLLRKDGEIPKSELDSLLETIERTWRTEYREALDTQDYRRALRLLISAKEGELPIDTVLQSDTEELKKEYVLQLAEGETPAAAFAVLRELGSMDVFSREELQALVDLALREYKRADAASLQDLLDSSSAQEDPAAGDPAAGNETADPVGRTYTHEELIAATVTIWVNRGMRIQDGVGLPDRVIGSGFYIDKRGYILTNYHVISSEVDPAYEGYSRLYVRPSEDSKDKIPARVVGWDPAFDIALLKIEREVDTVLSFSPHLDHRPGERIFAIGSPAGLENTITSGIVSATGRRFLQMGDVIQVDVPINQGNSGGPLLDESGHLIGVVYAGIEQFEGINFAIPAEWVLRVIDDLYAEGQVKHAFFGAGLEEIAERLEVSYVFPGGPADKIGLQVGDRLKSIAGNEPDTVVAAQRILLDYDPHTLLDLRWERQGREMNGKAALIERPDVPMMAALKRDRYERLFAPLFGVQVEKTVDSMFKTRYIVEKVYRGSIGDDVGLSENDPFSIQKWEVMEKEQIALVHIRIRKRKAGFLETGVQLGTYLEISNII
jgi:serine protease Do